MTEDDRLSPVVRLLLVVAAAVACSWVVLIWLIMIIRGMARV